LASSMSSVLRWSRRHTFQASTPFLSNATCSSFAIGVSWCRYGYSVGYRCYAREHTANSGSNNDGVALTIFLKPGCLAFVSNQNAKGRLIANDLVALISRHRKRYEVTQ